MSQEQVACTYCGKPTGLDSAPCAFDDTTYPCCCEGCAIEYERDDTSVDAAIDEFRRGEIASQKAADRESVSDSIHTRLDRLENMDARGELR